jgi:ADP-ribose pyrophosphatase YjhB (NUDIX family)
MPKLADNVRSIDEIVLDAKSGLRDDLFYLVSRLTPLVNVDLLIKNNKNEILLTWRADKYYGPGWHIPGGIIRFKERWETRIHAVAARELNAKVTAPDQPIAIKQLFAPQRDVRGHFISLLFECQLLTALDEERRAGNENTRKNGDWLWHRTYPNDMIWQHKIYEDVFQS